MLAGQRRCVGGTAVGTHGRCGNTRGGPGCDQAEAVDAELAPGREAAPTTCFWPSLKAGRGLGRRPRAPQREAVRAGRLEVGTLGGWQGSHRPPQLVPSWKQGQKLEKLPIIDQAWGI